MPADLRTALADALGPAVTLGPELGGGAMARVFRARDTGLERDIVVKVLPPELAGEVSAERFRREIAVAASLVHPQVVPVLAAGDAGGMPWYTMPFVAGPSLARRLAEGPPLTGVAAVSVVRDVARALAAAHAQGIVHRDVKPGNVLLVGDAAVVTDFGIAKAIDAARGHDDARTPAHGATLTRAGVVVGTPAYMAPEQVAGELVDARADVYAWGVVAYELLAGRHPFAAATTTQRVLAAQLSEVPPPLGGVARGVPPAIADVVMQALAKEPAERYADGGVLLAAIDAALTGERRAMPGARETSRGPSARMRRGAIALAVVALGAGAVRYARGAGAARAPDSAAPAARDSAESAALLAVLPFTSIGTAADSGFAEGLADAVTNKLANLAGLRVIDHASVTALGAKAEDPRAVGSELGARFALRATIRWATGPDGKARVQVTPVIVRTGDGTTLRSLEPIEASPSDPFAMQATMASQVADALDIAIAAVERDRIRRPATTDMQAWAAFERARRRVQRAERRRVVDPTELATAFAELDDAVARDPAFLEAIALRARLMIDASELGFRPPAARDSGLKALRAVYGKDPGTFPAAGLLADEALRQGRIAEAVGLVDGAIAARPSDPGLQLLRGRVAVAAGDTAALRDALRRALALAPRDVRTLRGVGRDAIASLHDSVFANDALRRAARFAPDDPDVHAARLFAADATGDTVAMADAWRAYLAAGGPPSNGMLAYLRRGTAAMRRVADTTTLAAVGARAPLDTIIFLEQRASLLAAQGDLAGARVAAARSLAVGATMDTTRLFFADRALDRYARSRMLALAGRPREARALLDSLATPAVRRDTIQLDAPSRALATCMRAQAWALLRDTGATVDALRDCVMRPGGAWPAWVRREPEFAPYLRDPRVQRLLAEASARPVPQAVRR